MEKHQLKRYGLLDQEVYKMNKDIKFGLREVSSRQLVKAGLTLTVGHLILPLIPFKDARNFEVFKGMDKKSRKGGKK